MSFVELFDWMLDSLDSEIDVLGEDAYPGEDPGITNYRDIVKATTYLVFVVKGK